MSDLRNAIDGVPNAALPFPHLATGGQPVVEHIEALARTACTRVIDLRLPMEPRGFDEGAVVEAHGMAYANHPVHPGSMMDEAMRPLQDALRAVTDTCTFVHCGSGDRVGGILIPHLMLDHGYTEEDAIATATTVGLRSPALVAWALDYVQRHA